MKEYDAQQIWSDVEYGGNQHEGIIFVDKSELKAKDKEIEELLEIVKAVAHIGIDWGYGTFELTQDHIDKARKLYEASNTKENES